MKEFLDRQRTGTVCISDRLFPVGLAGSRSPCPGSRGPDHRVRGPITPSAKQHNLEHTPRVGVSGDPAMASVMPEHPQAGRLCVGALQGSRAVVLPQCGWTSVPLPRPGRGHLLLKGLRSSKLQKTPTKNGTRPPPSPARRAAGWGGTGTLPSPVGGQEGSMPEPVAPSREGRTTCRPHTSAAPHPHTPPSPGLAHSNGHSHVVLRCPSADSLHPAAAWTAAWDRSGRSCET